MHYENKNFAKLYYNCGHGLWTSESSYPLTELVEGIINANNYAGIPKKIKEVGKEAEKFMKISRLKHLPLIGDLIFNIMDYFQRIEPFYPIRDLSKATVQLKTIYSMIKKVGVRFSRKIK